MSAANEFSNDARRVKDQAAMGTERVGEDMRQTGEDAREELAKLRSQVERLMQERVTPALADAAGQVQDYAARAREKIEDQADAFSDTVRERPLTTVAIAAAAGYLIGRLMGSNTYVYPRDRH